MFWNVWNNDDYFILCESLPNSMHFQQMQISHLTTRSKCGATQTYVNIQRHAYTTWIMIRTKRLPSKAWNEKVNDWKEKQRALQRKAVNLWENENETEFFPATLRGSNNSHYLIEVRHKNWVLPTFRILLSVSGEFGHKDKNYWKADFIKSAERLIVI